RRGVASCAGALAGGCALLALPPGVFEVVVPALIIIACVLVVLQPRLSAWTERRKGRGERVGPLLFAGVFVAGVYGGYFGAAQGGGVVRPAGGVLSWRPASPQTRHDDLVTRV